MSILKRIKQDKEIVAMVEKCMEIYGYNPKPFNYDEYDSVDDYKEKLKEFTEELNRANKIQK